MSETNLLIGSLSNDLFRIATFKQRGADTLAIRFLNEAKRWAEPLSKSPLKPYIQKIVNTVCSIKDEDLTLDLAEDCLMYGVLLQNYVLHATS